MPSCGRINPGKLPPPDTHVLISCRIYEPECIRRGLYSQPNLAAVVLVARRGLEGGGESDGSWLPTQFASQVVSVQLGFKELILCVSYNSSLESGVQCRRAVFLSMK